MRNNVSHSLLCSSTEIHELNYLYRINYQPGCKLNGLDLLDQLCMNTQSIKEQFFKYLYGEITLKEFEEWIYNYEELEVFLGKDHYIDLISFNFNCRDAKVYIKELFKKKFNWEEFEYWRTKKNINRHFKRKN